MPAEIKILERAEMYLRKLSEGVNPLTEEALPETDVCKQERISKCLTYVADYLKQKVMPVMERREKVVPCLIHGRGIDVDLFLTVTY